MRHTTEGPGTLGSGYCGKGPRHCRAQTPTTPCRKVRQDIEKRLSPFSFLYITSFWKSLPSILSSQISFLASSRFLLSIPRSLVAFSLPSALQSSLPHQAAALQLPLLHQSGTLLVLIDFIFQIIRQTGQILLPRLLHDHHSHLSLSHSRSFSGVLFTYLDRNP